MITTENLSIYDDGTLDGGLNSGVCDGEGTASKRTTLVEDGLVSKFFFYHDIVDCATVVLTA